MDSTAWKTGGDSLGARRFSHGSPISNGPHGCGTTISTAIGATGWNTSISDTVSPARSAVSTLHKWMSRTPRPQPADSRLQSQFKDSELMQFQVMGESGYTQPCLVALDTALSGSSNIHRATVVTKNDNEHLFILWGSEDHPQRGTIIPTGFASG